MDPASPISSVIPSSHGSVLEVLARATTPLSGRMVARLTGGRVSQSRANRVLNELVASGLVSREIAAPAYLYTLNHDHVAADAVLMLASLRSRLLSRIHDDVESWEQKPSAVWLFGSFARGDGDEASDIDLFVLRPDHVDEDSNSWVDLLQELSANVSVWSGNSCSVIEYSETEFTELGPAGERLPAELASDGVRVWGREIPRLDAAGRWR